jgi:hypothetical protein
MSEVNVLNVISADDVARFILGYCRNGRSSSEVINASISYHRQKGLSSNDEMIRGWTAQKLLALERAQAIEFRNGVWIATDIGKSVLQKFFGI